MLSGNDTRSAHDEGAASGDDKGIERRLLYSVYRWKLIRLVIHRPHHDLEVLVFIIYTR